MGMHMHMHMHMRMHILRQYICSFSDLQIRAVMLDQLLREPENPVREHMVSFETQALREARELLETNSSTAISDAQVRATLMGPTHHPWAPCALQAHQPWAPCAPGLAG